MSKSNNEKLYILVEKFSVFPNTSQGLETITGSEVIKMNSLARYEMAKGNQEHNFELMKLTNKIAEKELRDLE